MCWRLCLFKSWSSFFSPAHYVCKGVLIFSLILNQSVSIFPDVIQLDLQTNWKVLNFCVVNKWIEKHPFGRCFKGVRMLVPCKSVQILEVFMGETSTLLFATKLHDDVNIFKLLFSKCSCHTITLFLKGNFSCLLLDQHLYLEERH